MSCDAEMEPDLALLLKKVSSEMCFSEDGMQVQRLFGDGSDRRFFRIRQGASHFIVLLSPRRKAEGTDENDSYFLIGRHLHGCAVPVPQIIWADPASGFFVMEDVGDFHLQSLANRPGVKPSTLYRRVLGLLIHLHRNAHAGFETRYCFDNSLYEPSFVYERELEYFRNAFLVGYLGLDLGPQDLRRDFEDLAAAAGIREPSLVIHRDFQSRNIMVYRSQLRLIDFQGMRYGPPAYDLASLLVDPYVVIPPSLQESLVELYWSRTRDFLGCSHRCFMESYSAVRLCRNLQALGAYGYLGLVKGKKQFFHHIPRAWQRLHHWVNGPCNGKYPTLQKWVNRIHHAGLGGLPGRVRTKMTDSPSSSFRRAGKQRETLCNEHTRRISRFRSK